MSPKKAFPPKPDITMPAVQLESGVTIPATAVPVEDDYATQMAIIARDMGIAVDDLKLLPAQDGSLTVSCTSEAALQNAAGITPLSREDWQEAGARLETLDVLNQLGAKPNTDAKVLDASEAYMLANAHLYTNAGRRKGPGYQ